MATEILMPELGESVHEGTVTRWLKDIGDAVKEDEPVVEIMTDKVNTELQAPASGILVKILVPEGENVQVFQPLGLIGSESEAVDGGAPPVSQTPSAQPKTALETPAPAASPAPAMKAGNGRKFYTPVVRSIASRQGISEAELSNIQGSGEGGRVTKRDVEAFIASRGKVQHVESKPAAQPISAGPDQEVFVLTGMRKAIAEAMVKAHQIPSVSTICEVDCSRMVAFRTANKQSFQEMYGVKMTYTPFFVKAATEALLEVPQVNSAVMDDGRVIQNRGVHMGIAVALGDGSQGLIVPVLRDCHKKTVIEIAKALDELVLKARESRLVLDDLQGATFSITNPGTYGALFGTPMIPPHQGGILGTYAIKDTPVAMDGMIAIRPIMHLVLSYDHRIIDGMVAGRFLKSVRERLESFDFFR